MGSLGDTRYYVLVEGLTDGQDDDVILDVKREPEPEWFDYASSELLRLNNFRNNGQRATMAEKAMHIRPPDTLGWINLSEGVSIVRERSPLKGNIDLDKLTDKDLFSQVADQMAVVSATNHARADNSYRPDVIPWSFEDQFADAVRDKHGIFVNAVVDFGHVYYHRVQKDWECFAAWYKHKFGPIKELKSTDP